MASAIRTRAAVGLGIAGLSYAGTCFLEQRWKSFLLLAGPFQFTSPPEYVGYYWKL